MTRMNSIHYSKAATALLAALVLLAGAGTVSAFDVNSSGAPDATQVDREVTVTYTIDDPFTNVSNQWTMNGETELRNANWTVQLVRAGSPMENGTTSYRQQRFSQDVSLDSGGDAIRVRITGNVPAISAYTYDEKETYLVAQLERATENETKVFVNDTAYHYTPESKDAREAILNASAAIEEAPGNNTAAKTDLDRAKNAYQNENFDLAQDLASDAKQKAESAQQSSQQTTTILMAAGAVLLLALIGGGIYYWSSQEEEYSKL